MNQRLIAAALWVAVALGVCAAEPAAPTTRPDLYDRQADGAGQIREALRRARTENKHVLVVFGVNGNSWCRRLHDLFTGNAAVARLMKDEYVQVLIDVDEVGGKQHNRQVDDAYGNPTRFGLPALVVLNSDGTPLATQGTASFEDGNQFSALKLVNFLSKWKPTT